MPHHTTQDDTAREKAEPDIYAGNRLMSRVLHTLNTRTCLSCGAKTDDKGELPCGH